MTEPLSFKEQWEAKKLLKKSKKKARNNAMKQYGMSKKEATSAVKRAVNRIAKNSTPVKAAARGG